MNLDCIYIILSKSFEKDRLYYLENYFKNNPINIPIEYIEPFYIGRDDNNINYAAVLLNGKPLPLWLLFLPEERRFEGTPPDF